MYSHPPRPWSSPPYLTIAECHRHATEARERAKHINDPVLKRWFIDVERGWLSRLRRHEFLERLMQIRD
jgi:hypothetical protein